MSFTASEFFSDVIAIDGPAGAGKSTIAKLLAEKMGYSYLDTGAMYRAVTYKALADKIDFSDPEALSLSVDSVSIRFEKCPEDGKQLVYLNGTDVTDSIRTPEVSRKVSAVAANPAVRGSMTSLQRRIGSEGKWVVDGRDIGSVVFPDARVKIFLTASIDARADRRYKELVEKGFSPNLDELKTEIADRDKADSSREVAPLIQAEDAVYLDTTGMNIPEVVERAIKIISTENRDEEIPVEESMTEQEIKQQEQNGMSEETMTMEELMAMEDSKFRPISRGAIVTGTIVTKNENGVYVDLGSKSEGIIEPAELENLEGELNPGDQVTVYIDRIENGQPKLSISKAKETAAWDELEKAYHAKTPIKVTIVERKKGGFDAKYKNITAFLPQSQLSFSKNNKDSIGQTFPMLVIEFSKAGRRKNVVVSERALQDKVKDKRRDELFEQYNEGDVIKGKVSRFVDYGVFLDLGDGVEGLVHRNDLSWASAVNPKDILKQDEEIEVKILKMVKENRRSRISLGLKQMTENPWEIVDERYVVGKVYNGVVKNLMDFGAFVELERGVEGLVHISDLSWARNIKHPSEVVESGETIKVMVKGIDKEEKRISLSLKETTEHPWETFAAKYQIGQLVEGKVNNMTTFGAFIEIEPGVEGLLHVSDMDWVKRINHPSEVLKQDEEVQVKILSIDVANRRLSLGLKQTTEDPWTNVDQAYKVGDRLTGTVTNLLPYGALVKLPSGVEGLLHVSEISWQGNLSEPSEVLKEGQELDVCVYEIEKDKQKIGLSMKRLENDPWLVVARKYPKDSIHQGTVSAILDNGIEIDLGDEVSGFVHISQLAEHRVNNPSDVVKVGDEVTYKVLELDRKNRKLKLSLKEAAIEHDSQELKKYQAESEQGFSDTIGDLFDQAELADLKARLGR